VITYEHGRWRSSLTPTEQRRATIDAVSRLSVAERAGLELVLGEYETAGASATADEVTEFEWDEVPLPIDEWLQSEHHVGETGKDLYPVLRKDMCELFHVGALQKNGYAEAVFCLHPATRVPLLDGTSPTIASLAERWSSDQTPFWVYSYVDGEIAPMKAVQPRQTGVDDYYRVTLDDGSTFTGNARHQMLRPDGSKLMIRDMEPGDSIMPWSAADVDEVGNHYVVKVEAAGHGPVYCLSVPGAGNFAISTSDAGLQSSVETTLGEKEAHPTLRSGVFSSNTGAIKSVGARIISPRSPSCACSTSCCV